MSNTVGIFRNLLALRRSRSAFGSKYYASRNGDTGSDKNSLLRGGEAGKGDRSVKTRGFVDGTPRRGTKIADLGHSEKGGSSSIRKSPPLAGKKNLEVRLFNKLWKKEKISFGEISRSPTFTSWLRLSPLMDLGNPVGKLVVGTIYRIVEGSAYIDFGWKFPAVCPLPKDTPDTPNESYKLGSKVVVQIKDLEITTRFLGDTEYTSLLEADCKLICPYVLYKTVLGANLKKKMMAASQSIT